MCTSPQRVASNHLAAQRPRGWHQQLAQQQTRQCDRGPRGATVHPVRRPPRRPIRSRSPHQAPRDTDTQPKRVRIARATVRMAREVRVDLKGRAHRACCRDNSPIGSPPRFARVRHAPTSRRAPSSAPSQQPPNLPTPDRATPHPLEGVARALPPTTQARRR